MSGDNVEYLQSAELDELEQRFEQGESVQANGQAQQAPAAPDIPTAEILKPILSVSFGLIFPKRPLSDVHCGLLADAYAPLIDKYFPNISANMGVELNAVLITVAVFGERMAEAASERQQQVVNKEKTAKEGNGGQLDWADSEQKEQQAA